MPESPTVTVYTDTTREPWVFADCRWKVDPVGCLHVFREQQSGNTMVAAFGTGSWALVHSDAEVWS